MSILLELFDQTAPWKYTTSDPKMIEAEFVIDGSQYTVEIVNRPVPHGERGDIYNVEFSVGAYDGDTWLSHNTGVTGTGNEYLVFSTVLDIIQTTVDKVGIKALTFSSDNINGTSSRTKLYNRMVRALSKSWNVQTKDQKHSTEYVLIKK